MVGDGLNDAPALAAAHVSISPISAVHIAQAQADALFLGERLMPVADALRLAAKARRLMLENLWLSFLYNMIAVPLAILGFVTPLGAAVAMSASSILVTLNALRARQSGLEPMNVLVYLVPLALALGGLGLAAFLWALRNRPVRRSRGRGLAGDQRRRSARRQAIAAAGTAVSFRVPGDLAGGVLFQGDRPFSKA